VTCRISLPAAEGGGLSKGGIRAGFVSVCREKEGRREGVRSLFLPEEAPKRTRWVSPLLEHKKKGERKKSMFFALGARGTSNLTSVQKRGRNNPFYRAVGRRKSCVTRKLAPVGSTWGKDKPRKDQFTNKKRRCRPSHFT